MSKIQSIASNLLVALLIIVLLLVVVFLLQNTGAIQVNFLVFDIQLPTIVLILVATIVGSLGGYLFAIRIRQLREKPSNQDI